MTDYTQAKTAQSRTTPTGTTPSAASNWNADFIWPSVVVIGGLIGTFAWVAFLAWCLWSLVFAYLF